MEVGPLHIETGSTRPGADARPAAPGSRTSPRRTDRGFLPLPTTLRPLRHRWYPPLKSAVEFLAALVLLVPALPVILLAAAAVRLTSRGPARAGALPATRG